jgi:hypothetical protein
MNLKAAASLFILFTLAGSIRADDDTTAAVLKRLESLERKQGEFEKLLKQKDERIRELESAVAPGLQKPLAPSAPTNQIAIINGPARGATNEVEASVESADRVPKGAELGELQPNYGGFKVGKSKWGELNLRIYTYARYLNHLALDKTYTDAFGRTRDLDLRHDIQLQKVQFQSMGWLYNPDLTYFLYAWSSNPTMGQGAQVVLAGNLGYSFGDYLKLGVGITSLPTTRSLEGSFPRWLKVDSRTMADEFFRGSYSSGVWASGKITEGLDYRVMLANNLSTLGVDAVQLDNKLQTFSGALTWMPSTGEYGPGKGFGDLEHHTNVATRFGGHFTYSKEDRQSQPGKEDPENTQIRLSDGTGLFDIDAFGPGTQVLEADYYMSSFDAGLKYRGFSLEGEYFLRWIRNTRTTGKVPFNSLFDHGPQLQASYMFTPAWQVYATGSKIFGEFGNPYDVSLGFNWYPVKKKGFERQFRINGEAIYVRRSPTGYSSFPYIVGANGPVFMLNTEFFF